MVISVLVVSSSADYSKLMDMICQNSDPLNVIVRMHRDRTCGLLNADDGNQVRIVYKIFADVRSSYKPGHGC